jgi:RNA polymerase sigma factor (sigma-70 family)
MRDEGKQIVASVSLDGLHARFHARLMAFFVRRMRDRVLAQDLTQETLLRVIAAHKVAAIESLERYLFRVALNLLRDHKNRETQLDRCGLVPIDEASASELEHQLVEDLSPERVLLSRDSLAEVLDCLDELGERTREIFVLFRLERMKQKDIAVLLGIGQSTVEKHVMKATLHLATRFGGGTPC